MKKLLAILLFLGVFSFSALSQSETSGIHNGHEWVDLGLSVKWATCNVGAFSPEEYGGYFAWGETGTKSEFNSNCDSSNKSWSEIAGNPSRDVARPNWGGDWRMPTESELQELIDNCTWTWTIQNGHKGHKVTSKKNGMSIFLPAAGLRNADTLFKEGEAGYYWSSTSDEKYLDGANSLYCGKGRQSLNWGQRFYGLSVRPVLED